MIDLSSVAGVELQEDRISDAKWLKKSGVYTAEVDMAYMMESANGAKGIVFNFLTEAGEKFSKTIYVTNRNGEPFYIVKQGKNKGNQEVLPGMMELFKYSELMTGDREAFNKTEDAIYPVYDKDTKGEVEKTVASVPAYVGKVVQLALRETVEDKTALNSGSGKYEPTGETRIVLEISAMLDGATGKTLSEKTANLPVKYKSTFLKKIEEEPVYVPKKVVGSLPAGMDSKDSGEHKPKVNADDGQDETPFG